MALSKRDCRQCMQTNEFSEATPYRADCGWFRGVIDTVGPGLVLRHHTAIHVVPNGRSTSFGSAGAFLFLNALYAYPPLKRMMRDPSRQPSKTTICIKAFPISGALWVVMSISGWFYD